MDEHEWAELISADERATPFHRPQLSVDLAHAHPGWSASWLEARSEGHLVAGLPLLSRRRLGLCDWVSGFGGTYAGPVAGPDWASAEQALALAFSMLGGWRTLRREMIWSHREAPRGEWGNLVPLPTSVISLRAVETFEDFLQLRFPKNRRNECNRSERRGLTVEREAEGASLSELYPIYIERCRRWKSFAIAESALRRILERVPEAVLFVARLEGRVVGGHVCIDLGQELFAWVGTTLRLERTFPSALLIREEARWCHQHGRSTLNLGSSMGLSGVTNYKRLLGAMDDPRWIVRQCPRWWRWLGRARR